MTSSVGPAPAHMKYHLNKIAELSNIPRKPKQFVNFAANSLKLKNSDSIVQEIWEYLKKRQEEEKQSSVGDKESSGNGNTTTTLQHSLSDSNQQCTVIESKSSREVVDKPSSEASAPSKTDGTVKATKEVRKAMRKVLKKEMGKSLHMKLLSKKVRMLLGLPRGEGKALRKTIRQSASEGKKFVLNKKVIALKVE